MENNTPELLPCPFCGFQLKLCIAIKYNATWHDHPDEAPHDCILIDHCVYSDYKSKKRWNTRAKYSDKGGNT